MPWQFVQKSSVVAGRKAVKVKNDLYELCEELWSQLATYTVGIRQEGDQSYLLRAGCKRAPKGGKGALLLRWREYEQPALNRFELLTDQGTVEVFAHPDAGGHVVHGGSANQARDFLRTWLTT